MDVGVLRQSFAAVPVHPTRLDALAPRDAVTTELSAGQSVSAAAGSDVVRTDVSPHAATLSRLAEAFQRSETRFERDRKTEALVFKRIDPATGEVLLQIPDQSLLDLRAYLRQTGDTARSTAETTGTAIEKTA
ncbi:flagellar protein FlaG [Labrys wisconsinensis]|uniref:FlaG/YvyC family protein n=1 Tax=Labrys wisconsinensis TaxID=425677 RepID=A0ABU0JFK6_9HYPH|nr:flagellar protein FlaG [Labrys wisconsinensis]MDQ0473060.1 putative FlaG/YvyC family protein [Labrys wisconsinensis]